MFRIIKVIVIIVLLALIHLYFYTSEYVKKIDYQVYDRMMTFSNKVKIDNGSYTVIVDIDEKSLQELGQWPWPRVITSNLIDDINRLNPSAIGINIFFPEVDSISPVNIQAFYKRFFKLEVEFQKIPQRLKDNDKLLFESVVKSGTTLSTYFHNDSYTSKHCQDIVYQKNIFVKRETALHASSFLCNHKSLQTGVENFGFINAWNDSDGILRRIPLFIKYEEKVFPSFALATLLSFDKDTEVDTKEDILLLNFPLQKPKVFSAIDVLTHNVPMSEIQGKIVILGSSLVGVAPMYTTARGETISNSMIHSVAINNILNDNFLRQAQTYKVINVLISFILTLLFIFLFSKKYYFQIIAILVLILLLSFLWTLYFYIEGVYVSISYLLFPFLFLFILLIIYHTWAIHKEQQEQEKLFIRQSKLASMGEMISLIAHQWRQPLSSINGTVLSMDVDYRKEQLDSRKFNGYLDEIESTTAYLSKTISDFTDFFSKNKQAYVFSLSSIMRQLEHLSAVSTLANINVTFQNTEDLEIKGYGSELVQSLLVLLNNAVFICQEKLDIIGEGKIVIDVEKSGKNIIISVEDNGGGIAKKDIKKVFSPYFTTKDKHNGTGLGLYILKLIVEDSMNGKVAVRNGKEGAIFTIEIPKNIK